MRRLEVEILPPFDGPLLAPAGIATPHGRVAHLAVAGGRIETVALTHSMGHRLALPGRVLDLKLLGEPMQLPPDGAPAWTTLVARLSPAA